MFAKQLCPGTQHTLRNTEENNLFGLSKLQIPQAYLTKEPVFQILFTDVI